MILTSWIAYVSFGLLLFLLAPTRKLPRHAQVGALAAALLIGAIPLPGGMPLAGYLRAVTDDLAITTLLLLGAAASQRLGWLVEPRPEHRLQLCVFFAVIGIVLYPAALGVGMLDPYRWGYAPVGLLLVVGAIALWMVWTGNRALALVLALATVAYALRLKASPNYWDYLVDPLLVAFAVFALLRWCVRRLVRPNAAA